VVEVSCSCGTVTSFSLVTGSMLTVEDVLGWLVSSEHIGYAPQHILLYCCSLWMWWECGVDVNWACTLF